MSNHTHISTSADATLGAHKRVVVHVRLLVGGANGRRHKRELELVRAWVRLLASSVMCLVEVCSIRFRI